MQIYIYSIEHNFHFNNITKHWSIYESRHKLHSDMTIIIRMHVFVMMIVKKSWHCYTCIRLFIFMKAILFSINLNKVQLHVFRYIQSSHLNHCYSLTLKPINCISSQRDVQYAAAELHLYQFCALHHIISQKIIISITSPTCKSILLNSEQFRDIKE